MSLLLEALKKAEKAKEEAQRRARESGEAEASAKGVVTRDKLPDISPTLEIVSDDLAPPAAAVDRPVVEPAIEPLAPPKAPPPRSRPAQAAARAKPEPEDSAGRASAKKVFEAKFREPNPRMPFYITMGVLGVFAVGTVIYFWYQLRPPPPLVNLNPARQAEVAAAPTPEVRTVSAPAPVASPSQNAIPGLPAIPAKSEPVSAPQAAPAAKPRPLAEAPVETPRLSPRIPVARPVAPAAVPEGPSVSRTPAQVNPRVDAGYAAYVAGDLVAARTQYEQASRDEPGNRDALLGLAALEVRAGRYEAAEALYLRVLQSDPRDAQAQAALIALRSGRSDPLVTESRVKSLLAADPAAHALNFTLGNQLASQNRWAEAQQEYFKAYTAEPDNPDFAYNLAVSLDHLRQKRQALDYYERAIALAEKRAASFNLEAARARASQLAQ